MNATLYLTPEQVATLLQVKPITVRWWMQHSSGRPRIETVGEFKNAARFGLEFA
ncbi:MAG TPA: hypothetical protein VNG51_29835 [Ktedonobacteraceae bacterium]|nr:hypothetical protein [Ktedonobacteraceae bacterium]